MEKARYYLIGTGFEGCGGFSGRALEVIARVPVLIGKRRHLDLLPDYRGKKVELEELGAIVDFLRASSGEVGILCSGDPNFFGLGRFLLRNFPKEEIEILPNVTSVQYAFSRIKEPWDDAVFVSMHGRPLSPSIDRVIAADKVAILTDGTNTPQVIARELIDRGAEGYTAWLCENLGMGDERITRTDVRGLLELPAASLNILILIRAWEPPRSLYPLIGIDDDQFATSKKLITKEEVRVVTLARLKLMDGLCMWDVGAGSGSVSIEASNLMPNGTIHAVEQNPAHLRFLDENLKKFGARNVRRVEGSAPEALESLPDPDRVFIGGSNGRLDEIIDLTVHRLRPGGRIVLNAVTLDTLTLSVDFLENHGFAVDVTQVSIARTRGLSDYKLFEALNPVFVIGAWKEQG